MFSRQVVAFSVLCCSLAAASIKLTPSKAAYVPGLVNEEVELTCEVAESQNNKQVKSIVIKKHNNGFQLVASVTDNSAAQVAADQINVEVYGEVSGTSGKKSYLRLKWTRPTWAPAGKYECFVKSDLLLNGYVVHYTLSSSEVSIVANEPTIKGLISIVTDLQKKNQELSKEVISVKEQAIQEKAKSQTWANKVAINQGLLHELKKIRSGWYDCRNSGWKWGPHFKTRDVRIYFGEFYRIPIVHVSLAWINDDADDEDNEFGVQSWYKPSTGYFTMRCKSWKHNTNHNLVGTWITVPTF